MFYDLFGYALSLFGIGLHLVVALCFAIHAVRNRQDTYWLYILFMFPLMGSIVYFFVIYVPDLRHSRTARVATKTAMRIVDPNRAVREARADFDRAPSVQHRMRLGEALLATGSDANAKEARRHFEQAAQGAFATEPAVLLGLARAQFADGDPSLAARTMDQLFEHSPAARSQSVPTLLYARALWAAGQPRAREAFEQAIIHGDDASARCLFAEWLAGQSSDTDRQRARALFAEIEHDARHWPRFAREHNREWLKRAKAGLARA